jgi:hypothetical protein
MGTRRSERRQPGATGQSAQHAAGGSQWRRARQLATRACLDLHLRCGAWSRHTRGQSEGQEPEAQAGRATSAEQAGSHDEVQNTAGTRTAIGAEGPPERKIWVLGIWVRGAQQLGTGPKICRRKQEGLSATTAQAPRCCCSCELGKVTKFLSKAGLSLVRQARGSCDIGFRGSSLEKPWGSGARSSGARCCCCTAVQAPPRVRALQLGSVYRHF